jgi:hypothetical protein
LDPGHTTVEDSVLIVPPSTAQPAGGYRAGERLAEAAGLSVPRVYQIKDGRR